GVADVAGDDDELRELEGSVVEIRDGPPGLRAAQRAGVTDLRAERHAQLDAFCVERVVVAVVRRETPQTRHPHQALVAHPLHPAANRVEHVVPQEPRRRVLHPHVDRHLAAACQMSGVKLRAMGRRVPSRVAEGLLIALMGLGSIFLWVGIPAGWLYIASRLSDKYPKIYLLALLFCPLTMIVFGWLLARVNGVYIRLFPAQE